MKILKYFLIFLGFMIAGFVLFMTFSKSEFTADIDRAIQADRDQVYAVFTDTARLKKIKPNVVKVNLQKGNAGETGSVMELTYQPDEQALTISQELLEAEPGRRLVYAVNAPKVFTETRTIELSDSADWVKVHIQRHVKAENWLIKLFLSQLAKALPEETRTELDNLEQLIKDEGPSEL